jgi:pyruvate,water dikinase
MVSREFGIPCIVGTKKATAILKNGQKIFVDANKGLIYEI